jgi:hypothetical protein
MDLKNVVFIHSGILLSHEEELENIILSKVSQSKKTKKNHIICSPSYVDFRSRANAAMLLDLGHTLRGEHIGDVCMGIGRKTKT